MNQYMANIWIRTNKVAPGDVNRKIPMITAAIPSNRMSHQGTDLPSCVVSTVVISVVISLLTFFLI
jgi:hypothetical protein